MRESSIPLTKENTLNHRTKSLIFEGTCREGERDRVPGSGSPCHAHLGFFPSRTDRATVPGTSWAGTRANSAACAMGSASVQCEIPPEVGLRELQLGLVESLKRRPL